MTPLEIVVAPEKVFDPPSNNVSVPTFVNAPVPEITASIRKPLLTSVVKR